MQIKKQNKQTHTAAQETFKKYKKNQTFQKKLRSSLTLTAVIRFSRCWKHSTYNMETISFFLDEKYKRKLKKIKRFFRYLHDEIQLIDGSIRHSLARNDGWFYPEGRSLIVRNTPYEWMDVNIAQGEA
jgi:hypothetical protein